MEQSQHRPPSLRRSRLTAFLGDCRPHWAKFLISNFISSAPFTSLRPPYMISLTIKPPLIRHNTVLSPARLSAAVTVSGTSLSFFPCVRPSLTSSRRSALIPERRWHFRGCLARLQRQGAGYAQDGTWGWNPRSGVAPGTETSAHRRSLSCSVGRP